MSRWKKNTSQLSNDQDHPQAPRNDDLPTDQEVSDTFHQSVEPEQLTPLHQEPPTDQDDAMDTDDPPQIHSPIISQYAAHIHRQTPLMSTIHTTTVHDSAVHNNTSVNTSPVHDSGDHNNTSVHASPVHDNTDHNNNTDHDSPDHETDEHDRIADNIPPSSHSSPVHIATIFLPSQNTDMISPAADEQYHPNSVIYDKSDHPNSPEINHILLHGKRIYDPISPDPTFSNPPVFDSTIGPSSPQGSHLRLSPLPFTPLTSPTKSTDSGLGFAGHAATPNAFTTTALSNTPPSIGSTASATQDGLVDLTLTKDPSRHVPSREENHLAKELLSSPLIPALALITPLPQIQWDLFHKILSANIDVYHVTTSLYEFSNKSLLQLAEPKHWTTSYVSLRFLSSVTYYLSYTSVVLN
ncbi:unnamed protein product [Eruca vesicaria subsp. sativa]|uniref:Uncharacterized protein n=1 Tax=Eruca vesicaria subsp. sativa TaxID=29727 RepID=A0ABC8KB88_ERUVS|nr:unnamed protein product [Eruca vesicaria subsp. sativa]